MDLLLKLLWVGLEGLEEYVLHKLGGAFIPAFFIAGAMSVFIPKHVVVQYLSKGVKKTVSYSIALIAGGILSVCACGILPLFQSIYNRGAGIGPSMTFLFAGPAINVIAIFYTFDLLGGPLGWARILCVGFIAIAIGLLFQALFEPKNPENESKPTAKMALLQPGTSHKKQKIGIFSALMVMVILLPLKVSPQIKYSIVAVMFIVTVLLAKTLLKPERDQWISKSLFLLKQIVPKLLLGIFIISILDNVARDFAMQYLANGEQGFLACLISSVIGAFLYLGTIIGIIAVHGLQKLGMEAGPALSFMLAGPTVALPSMFVIMSVCGKWKGLLFSLMVILFSAIAGWLFGFIA